MQRTLKHHFNRVFRSKAKQHLVPCLAASFLCLQNTSAQQEIDFNQQIRPLLSDKCFSCHGPDEKNREADLRLDTKNGAFADLDGHQAIVPGNADDSTLYQRLVTGDKEDLMPPPDSHKKISKKEIELLRRWIDSGAVYQEHWAFEGPTKKELPKLQKPGGKKNPSVEAPVNAIDFFIRNRLALKQLPSSPPANKQNLIRRVTFDLTGLPPTLEEIAVFMKDTSDDAYEKLIDRLLQSKHYGEHMARFWLDGARYADTHGLHLDNYREMWPYRDWVVRAYNNNQPFDHFAIEQLAGDLLKNPTLDQLIATGFNRAHVTTNEGGTIPEEFYVRNVMDRVETMGGVFMGMTLICSECHSHKYDPITQTEYYQLFSFFNNLDASPMDGNVEDHSPVVFVPSPEQSEKLNLIRSSRKKTRAQREAREKSAQADFITWSKNMAAKTNQSKTPSIALADLKKLGAHFPLDEKSGNQVANSTNSKTPGNVTGSPRWVGGKRKGAFQFADKDSYLDLGKVGIFDKSKPFSYGAWVKTPGDISGSVIAKIDPGRVTGYEMKITNKRVSAVFSGNLRGSIMQLDTGEVLKPGQWHHLFITYDGTSRATGVAIYVDGRKQDVDVRADQLGNYNFKTSVPLLLGRRNHKDPHPFTGGTIDDFRIYDRELSETEIARLAFAEDIESILNQASATRSDTQKTALETYYFTQHDSAWKELGNELKRLDLEEVVLNKEMPTTLIYKERKDIKPAYLLERGEYDRKKNKTERITPAIFPPMEKNQPLNRLGLARWLFSDDHPLTARVTANRFWQQVFGTGIVKTSEDFGSQGEPPSHPQLLDWLAIDFRESGWDVKAFMKQMLMSATYRQSSRTTPALIKQDPGNRLLAHGPRFRLDAEMLRDQALLVSGLLNPKMGGPAVKPPQPEGIWSAVGYSGSNTVKFKQDEGSDKVHRRTLYTFIKRTAGPPQMATFDAPSREACSLRRERTNTPLQALLMLNDPQYFEAARVMAEHTMKEGGRSIESRIKHMIRLCTAHPPKQQTSKELSELFSDQLAIYQKDSAAAKQLINVGESKPDPSLNPAELAAWTMVANTILNLDEVINKN